MGARSCEVPPIEDYGLLGDTRTAALVASDGSLDWLCVPRFDGHPVFGRLVGGPDAGAFRLGPAGPATVISRRYRPDSATLRADCAARTTRGGQQRCRFAGARAVRLRLLHINDNMCGRR